MDKVNETRSKDEQMKPCDCFDLICGTSTGGLIALMLGRLEFVRTVEKAIQEYNLLAGKIFRRGKAFKWYARYDHKPLEQSIQNIIELSPLALDKTANLVDDDRRCKSFVVTTNLMKHSPKAILLRAYGMGLDEDEDDLSNIGRPWTIWEAGRATSAAPTFFSAHKADNGFQYSDGGTIANNPTELGYQEARRLWPGRDVDLILSIGTGREKDLTVPNATHEYLGPKAKIARLIFGKRRFLKLQMALYGAMAMTSTERVHKRVAENIKAHLSRDKGSTAATDSEIYIRLNVEDEGSTVPLDAFDKMQALAELSHEYMRDQAQLCTQIVSTLLDRNLDDQRRFTLPPAPSALADDFDDHTLFFQNLLKQVQKGDLKMVEELVTKPDASTLKAKNWFTALWWAAYNGNEAIVELLLQEGAPVDKKDSDGLTALWWAAYKGNEAIVKLLLSNGSRVDTKDKNGRTELWCGVRLGNKTIVELLLSNRAAVDIKDNKGRTPLWWAIVKENEAIITLLLNHGAVVNAKDDHGRTPLWWAAFIGNEAIITLLLNHGAAIDTKDDEGETPLWWAVLRGIEAIVSLLLDNGAMVDMKDDNGKTPLLLAAYNGNEAMVSLLLNKGATVDIEDKNGHTALWYAIHQGNEAVVKLLRQKGAS
ncbi:hypothetical protein NQ176_g4736 [Zarea fungicola]|uniref:Uncharacterized protein n=1 Tax=Zarea fungicola TaxID=93591 RepID=A0ACC1NCL3_9HYPO|nr:hypothetical protein NQ176_g4736 [Lecanicillium fungicola]